MEEPHNRDLVTWRYGVWNEKRSTDFLLIPSIGKSILGFVLGETHDMEPIFVAVEGLEAFFAPVEELGVREFFIGPFEELVEWAVDKLDVVLISG